MGIKVHYTNLYSFAWSLLAGKLWEYESEMKSKQERVRSDIR